MWNQLPFKVVQALFRSWGVLVPLFWRTIREKGKIAQLKANLNSHTVIPACWIFPLSQQLADPKLCHCPLANKSSPAVGPPPVFFPISSKHRQNWWAPAFSWPALPSNTQSWQVVSSMAIITQILTKMQFHWQRDGLQDETLAICTVLASVWNKEKQERVFLCLLY